jgi:type IV secretion system protein VirB10
MPVTEIGDPRLQALFGADDPRDSGVRPTVPLPRRGLPAWALGVMALLFGVVLFLILESRRTTPPEPAIAATPGSFEAPPSLSIPPAPAPVVVTTAPPAAMPLPQANSAPLTNTAPRPAVAPVMIAPAPLPLPPASFAPPPARVSSGAPLVIDTSSTAAPAAAGAAVTGSFDGTGRSIGRVRASAFANRSTTVPQGYVIPAILETGFDSTQPGFARAVVSRDVHGFDGKNVLIPRGSRLIGEYKADVAAGQKRAIITWTRLIRPDGMTIAMDSPAVDTVGRGGVPASVNTHFFQRLTGALLQSTFSIGSALAGRSTGSVYVLPGATAAVPQMSAGADIPPTLTVAPGKSISVFVARDLDFSSAGSGN